MSDEGRYEGLTRADLIVRLTRAERLCVMYGWTPARSETDREKAATELWQEWLEAVPNGSDPKAWPELNGTTVRRLAKRRDATRERTLKKLRKVVS